MKQNQFEHLGQTFRLENEIWKFGPTANNWCPCDPWSNYFTKHEINLLNDQTVERITQLEIMKTAIERRHNGTPI